MATAAAAATKAMPANGETTRAKLLDFPAANVLRSILFLGVNLNLFPMDFETKFCIATYWPVFEWNC